MVIDSSGWEVVNSQVTICNNFHDLRMGFNKGRPRRKQRVVHNPFDLSLVLVCVSKWKGKGRQSIKDINSKGFEDDMDILNKNQ